jgi:RNA polymerase-binding transcription factor DksA
MTARKSATKKKPTKAATKAASRRSTATKARSTTKAKAVKSTRVNGKTTASKTTASKTSAAKRTAAKTTAAKNASAKKTVQRKAFRLNEKDAKRFEELLLTERERLMREMGHLENTVLNRSMREASGELSGYASHMADIGTDSMEREKAFLFASVEGRALLDVNEALRRLYNGQYGACEVCSGPVGKERLEVVPHARLCVTCKENEERSQTGRAR